MDVKVGNEEDIETILVAELLVFGMLGKILYTYPNHDFIDGLIEEDLFSEVPFGREQQAVKEGEHLINQWSGYYAKNRYQAMEDLRSDYTGLFDETSDKDISPWESVYFTEERSIFQEQTLSVRSWYKRFGLQIANLYKEPDDHIGLEFAFISHLASQTLQAMENGNEERVEEIIRAQKEFFSEHIMRWVPVWCDQVQEYAKTDFYRGLGWLVQGVLGEVKRVFFRGEEIGAA